MSFKSNSDSSKREFNSSGIYYLDMVECPLDPNHKFRRHRLAYHMLKCKKNYPNKVQCPYGHYCFFDKHEMANHLQTCPHKSRADQAEVMQPSIMQTEHARNENITKNYDVDNYEIDEPYWD